MNILIIQEKGRHKENWEFRECECLGRALKRLKHDVTICGLNYDTEYPKSDVDAVIVLENTCMDWMPDMSKYKCPKVFWSIDSHMGMSKHQGFVDRVEPDILLVSSVNHVKKFKNVENKFWMPNCYPADLIGKVPVENKYDVGFCGSWATRKRFLVGLSRERPIRFNIGALGSHMVAAINSYKIHLNMNIADDLNYRTFETAGCGTFLLTNETPGLKRCFGNAIITYKDTEDCLRLIDYYLENELDRESLAYEARKWAEKWHTYDNRAKEIVDRLWKL